MASEPDKFQRSGEAPISTQGMSNPRFKLPDGEEFDLPSDWWAAAAMDKFQHQSLHYNFDRAIAGVVLVKLAAIEPLALWKFEGRRHLDYRGLKRDTTIDVLQSIASGVPIKPITLNETDPGSRYPYSVHLGGTRYTCSVAAGFTHIPAVMWDG